MPEAAVDEDDRAPALHHNIRPAGQTADVEPIADTEGSEGTADCQFRAGVLAADRRHVRAAAGRGEAVSHIPTYYLIDARPHTCNVC